MLFQGQEFAASAPFQFFTDHNPELGKLVTEGRRKEFAGFAAFADPARRKKIPDPQAESTFRASVLDWSERDTHAEVLALYRALLHLRRDDPVLRLQDRSATRARALTPDLLAIRRWHAGQDRLLLANFGNEAVKVEAAGLKQLELSDDRGWRLLLATPNADGASPADLLTLPGRSARLLAR
jgi:maltooligosyltrehalose trehalohydrolase